MKKFLILVVGFAVCLGLASGPGQSQDKDRGTFMKMKLTTAQQVLNGVAVGDFALIERSADDLVRLGQKSEFQLMKTPEYGRYSEDFRRSAEALVNAAKVKNIDAAALAYVQLTLNCVVCHKYVRDVR